MYNIEGKTSYYPRNAISKAACKKRGRTAKHAEKYAKKSCNYGVEHKISKTANGAHGKDKNRPNIGI